MPNNSFIPFRFITQALVSQFMLSFKLLPGLTATVAQIIFFILQSTGNGILVAKSRPLELIIEKIQVTRTSRGYVSKYLQEYDSQKHFKLLQGVVLT